jgi:hypothetical protein
LNTHTIQPPPYVLALLAQQEARLKPPRSRKEAQRRLERALAEIQPIEDEINMLRAFLGRAR